MTTLLHTCLQVKQGELDDVRRTLTNFGAKIEQMDDAMVVVSQEKDQVEGIIAEVTSNPHKDSPAYRRQIGNFHQIVQSAACRLQNLKATVQGVMRQALEQAKEIRLALLVTDREPEVAPASSLSPEYRPTEEASSSHFNPALLQHQQQKVTGAPFDGTLK